MLLPAKPVLCPPPRHRVRGDGLLTSPITTATLPPPLRHTNSLPAQRAPPAALRAYSQGFRLSRCCADCVAPVLLLFLLHSAAARVPAPLSSADLAVADSPLFARRHPAAIQRRGRLPVGGQVPSTPVRTPVPSGVARRAASFRLSSAAALLHNAAKKRLRKHLFILIFQFLVGIQCQWLQVED